MEDSKEGAIAVLNGLVELELAGAVRYTQYSLMIFGHARIPIMHWMRQQASEALVHATEAGEEVTALGGRVSLDIGELAGTHHSSVDEILQELVLHERRGIELYRKLLKLSEGWDELQVCAACARLCKTVKRLQVRVCEGTWTWC